MKTLHFAGICGLLAGVAWVGTLPGPVSAQARDPLADLAKRVETLERITIDSLNVRQPPFHPQNAILPRLDAIEKQLADFNTKTLPAIDKRQDELERRGAPGGPIAKDTSAIEKRLDQLERRVGDGMAKPDQTLDQLRTDLDRQSKRVAALELDARAPAGGSDVATELRSMDQRVDEQAQQIKALERQIDDIAAKLPRR